MATGGDRSSLLPPSSSSIASCAEEEDAPIDEAAHSAQPSRVWGKVIFLGALAVTAVMGATAAWLGQSRSAMIAVSGRIVLADQRDRQLHDASQRCLKAWAFKDGEHLRMDKCSESDEYQRFHVEGTLIKFEGRNEGVLCVTMAGYETAHGKPLILSKCRSGFDPQVLAYICLAGDDPRRTGTWAFARPCTAAGVSTQAIVAPSAGAPPERAPAAQAPTASAGPHWRCHHYEGAQGNDWCRNAGQVGGWEYQFFGEQSPCGKCWCCKRPPPGSQATPRVGNSLFCFMGVLPGSSEVALKDAAQSRHASIFACDDNKVYWTERTGTYTIPDGTFSANAGVFLKLWQEVWKDEIYKLHDWTVKVDADCVWSPERLRPRLANFGINSNEAVWLQNSNIGFGFMGPIEILSQSAVHRISEIAASDCHFNDQTGEDGWLHACMDADPQISPRDDRRILYSGCQVDDCSDGSYVAYHFYKEPWSWNACLDRMR